MGFLNQFPLQLVSLSLCFLTSSIALADVEILNLPSIEEQKSYLSLDVEDKPKGAWVMLFGNNMLQKNVGNVSGFKNRTYGAGVGFDKRVTDSWMMGLGIRFDYSKLVPQFYLGTYNDFTSTRLFLNTRYDVSDRWFVNGTVSYALNQYNTERYMPVVGPAIRAQGDVNGQQWFLEANTGYQFSVDNWQFLPQAGLQYSSLNVAGYQEMQALTSVQRFASTTYESLKGNVDLIISYQNNFPLVQLLPFVHGRYFYDFIDDPQELTANVLGGGTSFMSFGPTPAQSSWQVGGGFALFGLHHVQISMRYDYTFKNAFHDNALMMYIHHNWA